MSTLFTPTIYEPPIQVHPVEIKALVRARDDYRCTDCGMSAEEHVRLYRRNLDVHRLVPNSKYTVEGCVTLCKPCHKTKPKSPRGTVRRTMKTMRLPLNQEETAALDALAADMGVSWRVVVQIALNEHLKAHRIKRRSKKAPSPSPE